MWNRATCLIIGVVLGIVGSIFFHSRLHNCDREHAFDSKSPSVIEKSMVGHQITIGDEIAESNEQPAKTELEIEYHPVAAASNIPSIYSELIGVPKPKRLSVADRHAQFLLESRDEIWALAMESGINYHLSENRSGVRFVVAHVECRSQHCEIAGYVPPGYQDDSDKLKIDLKNSDWWQGGISTASIAKEIDGIMYVVIIFNRFGGRALE